MDKNQLRLGEILVEAGVLGKEQLVHALSIQKKRGLRLGQILLQEEFISEPQLVQALSRRLSIPWVSLEHVDIPDELLELVPAHVAEEFFLVPVYIQQLDRHNRTLFVAMNDPTDEAALRFVSATAGMAVKPMVAGPSDISVAIQMYYYGEEDSGAYSHPEIQESYIPISIPAEPDLMFDSIPTLQHRKEDIDETIDRLSSEEPISIVELSDNAIALIDKDSREPEQPVKDKEPKQDAADRHSQIQREVEKHMFGVGGKHRGMSLTLLDGTRIDFGGANRRRSLVPPADLGRDALVKALRAVARGEAPEQGKLPAEKWESYIAALLHVLFKKNLLFYDEFIRALEEKE
jgi:type IV pilus assembly protein PilB